MSESASRPPRRRVHSRQSVNSSHSHRSTPRSHGTLLGARSGGTSYGQQLTGGSETVSLSSWRNHQGFGTSAKPSSSSHGRRSSTRVGPLENVTVPTPRARTTTRAVFPELANRDITNPRNASSTGIPVSMNTLDPGSASGNTSGARSRQQASAGTGSSNSSGMKRGGASQGPKMTASALVRSQHSLNVKIDDDSFTDANDGESSDEEEEVSTKVAAKRGALIGRVVHVSDNNCFIKPYADLPDGYPRQNVRLAVKNMKIPSDCLTVIPGDVIQFVMADRVKEHCAAMYGSVIQFKRRNPRELSKILGQLEAGLARPEVTMFLSCSPPFWSMCGKSVAENSDVRRLVSMQLSLMRSAELKESFKDCVLMLCDGKFAAKKGPLERYVRQVFAQTEEEDVSNIKQYLLALAKLDEKLVQRVVYLVEVGVRANELGTSLSIWMLDLLKVTAKYSAATLDIDLMQWNTLPLIPGTREVLASAAFDPDKLNGVKLESGYADSDEYLDTYFRLMRAECFSQITRGIRQLLQGDLDLRNMNVFIGLRLKAFYIDRMDAALVLVLSIKPVDQKRKWRISSGSLMSGNLLCISPSGRFDDPLWATVRDRVSDKDQLEVAIEAIQEWTGANLMKTIKALMTNGESSILAESPSYYPSIGPVLKSLQMEHFETVPFEEEIVRTEFRNNHPPEYIPDEMLDKFKKQKLFDEVVTVDNATLDPYQSQAFLHALTNRVALIQGPPGTGKTFIGKMIVNQILKLYPDAAPILVLTYKNHALDEFLKGIAEYVGIENVARVGGRGDSELESCNLNQLRREKKDATIFSAIKDLIDEKEEISNQLMETLKELNAAAFLDAGEVHQLLTDDELKNFLSKMPYKQLKGQLPEGAKNTVDRFLADFRRTPDSLPAEVNEILQAAIKFWAPPLKSIADQQAAYARKLNSLVDKFNGREEKPPIAEQQDQTTDDDDDDADDDQDKIEENEERITLLGKTRPDKRHLKTIAEFASDFKLNSFNWQSLTDVDFLDVWNCSTTEKVQLVGSLLSRSVDRSLEKLKLLLDKLSDVRKKLKQLDRLHEASILSKRKVIAMTITGASIHQDLVVNLKPSVVVVEEAAEILECSLIAALGPNVKHLILIGDHQQLRPNVDTYELRTKCRFDVSLFERLVKRGIPCVSLLEQNRMRPEMALLLHDIYPDLRSNSRVESNQVPPCLKHSISFWNHRSKENKQRSVTNEEEAERVAGLVQFLVSQGVAADKITVLAMYLGQVGLIRKKISAKRDALPGLFPVQDAEKPYAAPVNVSTVDNYQGDENDVIIVSLVRSNDRNSFGFVDTLNRRCVAQSRAKCATIYIGNADFLRGARHWRNFLAQLDSQKIIQDRFTLICQYHTSTGVDAVTSTDLQNINFCKQECRRPMSCNLHHCRKICHPIHDHSRCTEKVPFTFKPCGHPDSRECHQKEEDLRCRTVVWHTLSFCGHRIQEECCIDKQSLKCFVEVRHQFPVCGHERIVPCHQRRTGLQCKETVEHVFKPCLHKRQKMCSEDSSHWICKVLCPRRLPCNHPCGKLCGEMCDPSLCETCKQIQREKERQRIALEKEQREKFIKEAGKEIEQLKELLKSKPENTILRQDLKRDGGDAAEYQSIEDRVMKYIQPDHRWYPRVNRIEKVTNNELKILWLEEKADMFKPDYSDLKFHGTSKEAVEGIVREGFRLPQNAGMYGRGVYFATDSSKSAQEIYTKGSNMLLLCDVLLGKVKEVKKAAPDMDAHRLRLDACDSLYAPRNTKGSGGVLYDEFVIYNPRRALPVFIIHYSCENYLNVTPKLPQITSSFERIPLSEKRSYDPNDPLDHLYRTAESQYYRLLHANRGQHFTLDKVEYVRNQILEQNFNSKERFFASTGQPTERILAFHGTASDQNIDSIVKDGFDDKKISRCAHGFGAYFSEDPTVSYGYMSNMKLLLCDILPGKVFPGPLGNMRPIPQSYYSHGVSQDAKGRYQILVIKEMDQILPRFILHFK